MRTDSERLADPARRVPERLTSSRMVAEIAGPAPSACALVAARADGLVRGAGEEG